MIVGVAVKFGDYIEVRMPAPNRHCHCFWHFMETTGLKALPDGMRTMGDQQGFYTNKGVFLTRRQAFRHVMQIKQPTRSKPHKVLFSEDMW
jgi:hypothetical protein